MDINICTFTGRLGKRPEMKKTTTGKSVTTCSIAVNGAKPGSTTWVQLECWDKIAENICNHCDQGTYIAVTGCLKNKEYTDTNGNKRNSTVIAVQNFQMIGNRERRDSDAYPKAEITEFASVDDEEDALPF